MNELPLEGCFWGDSDPWENFGPEVYTTPADVLEPIPESPMRPIH